MSSQLTQDFMEHKKTLMLFAVLMFSVLCINLVSAGLLDTKSFDPNGGKYGKITIKGNLGLSDKAEYTLEDYGASLIDVYAEGTYKLSKKTKLFTGVFYKDIAGEVGDLQDVEFFIWVNESYVDHELIFEDSCTTDKNGTICKKIETGKNEVLRYKSYWKLYKKGTDLDESEGRWRLEAKRPINKKIDFILEAHGKEFTEWAWWDLSWNNKKAIYGNASSSQTNYPIFINVTYDLDMNSNFSDLRFTNAAEDTEFNYWIQPDMTVDGSYAGVYVNISSISTSNVTIAYMYYGNPSAASESNGTKVFDFFDDFDRADSGTVGNGWTESESTGTVSINGGTLQESLTSGSIHAYHSTSNILQTGFRIKSSTMATSGPDILVRNGGSYGPNLQGFRQSNGIYYYDGTHNLVTTASAATYYFIHLTNLNYGSDTYDINVDYVSEITGAGFDNNIASADNILIATDTTGGLVTNTDYIWTSSKWADTSYYFGAEEQGSTFQINLVEPEDYYNSTSNNIDFGCNATDETGVYSLNLTINGSVYESVTGAGNTNLYLSSTEVLADGTWEWYCTANDDTTATNSSTRYLTVDTAEPTISIEAPTGLFTYLKPTDLLDLNVTATDSHLDSCWYDYNGTNISFSCSSGVKASEVITQDTENFSVIVYANDTFGNENSGSTNWGYSYFETAREYSAIALQTATETYKLVGLKNSSITSITGTLVYNGTEYIALKTQSGNAVNFSTSLDVPTTYTGNVSFFWMIDFTNSTGSYSFNTTESNQTIVDLSIEECFSPNLDGLTLNFTTYDSTNLTVLNTTLEATFQFYAESGSGDILAEYLFSDLNENRSNYMYCLNSSGENVTLDAFISYDATDYDRREYIIDDGIIGNFTQNIPLYLTQTALTDIVTITVQDQNYDPIAGAIVAIQRWNIGTNTYSTVGMLTTSSSGQGIIDLELYTTWYRAVVTYNGEIIETTDVQKLSGTSWIITVEVGVDNPYDLFGNVGHGLTFDNSTNITSFTWLDNSGYTSQGCLIVTNASKNECVESVSGTIDYMLVGDGTYTAYGILYLDGYNQSQIVDTLIIQLGTPEATQTISPFGKIISGIVIGTMGLIGVAAGSALLGIFLVVVAIIALVRVGFLNMTWGFIWGIISIGIIIAFLQGRKR